MIETKGTYHFSKDGGKTWLEVPNMLVTGYYKYQEHTNIHIGIGSDGREPLFKNTALPNVLQTYTNDGLKNISMEIKDNEFLIHTSQTFNFGTGHTFVARDIGMSIGSKGALASRALFRDNDGNPIEINITADDVITVNYTLTYILTRAPIPVALNLNGRAVTGTMRICNPNKWGTKSASKPVSLYGVGLGAADTWAINESGYQTSTDSGLVNFWMYSAKVFSESKKTYRHYQDFGVNGFNTTFKQIAFSDSSFSPNNIVILIDLDEEVTNTPNDELTLGINIIQEHVDDSQQS